MSANANPSRKEEERALQHIRTIRGTSTSGPFYDFIHFLLDYNIIGYTAAFVIAVSASELFNSVGSAVVKTSLRALHLSDYMGDLIKNLIAFVIIVGLVFLLMYTVIQPIVASRQVQEERKVKQVVKVAQEKVIEKTAENVNPIRSTNIDGFSSTYAMF